MPQVTWNGTTFNLVTVTGSLLTLIAGNSAPCAGNLQFSASDLAWSTTLGMIGYMPQIGVNLDATGSFTCELFAMDNANVSTVWEWILSGTINGYAIPRRKLTVNYANGDSQTLPALLATSTLA